MIHLHNHVFGFIFICHYCFTYMVYQLSANLFSCQTSTKPPGDLCFPQGCTGRASPRWWSAWQSVGPLCCLSKTQRDTFLGALPLTPGKSNLSSRVREETSTALSQLTILGLLTSNILSNSIGISVFSCYLSAFVCSFNQTMKLCHWSISHTL